MCCGWFCVQVAGVNVVCSTVYGCLAATEPHRRPALPSCRCSASHIPRPGQLRPGKLTTGATGSEGSLADAPASGAGAGRRVLSASNSLASSADSRSQGGKLQRLRAAVEALEADAAVGRLGKRRVPGLGMLEFGGWLSSCRIPRGTRPPPAPTPLRVTLLPSCAAPARRPRAPGELESPSSGIPAAAGVNVRASGESGERWQQAPICSLAGLLPAPPASLIPVH